MVSLELESEPESATRGLYLWLVSQAQMSSLVASAWEMLEVEILLNKVSVL